MPLLCPHLLLWELAWSLPDGPQPRASARYVGDSPRFVHGRDSPRQECPMLLPLLEAPYRPRRPPERCGEAAAASRPF